MLLEVFERWVFYFFCITTVDLSLLFFFFFVDVDEVFSTFLAASAHSLVFYLSKFFFFLFDFDCLFASCLELLMGLLVKKPRWL
jgi:hypothetical protein